MGAFYGNALWLRELLEQLSSNSNPEDGSPETSSRRQIEAALSAKRKSSDEIAIILDLSSHVVDGYLKSAMSKPYTVNRTQGRQNGTGRREAAGPSHKKPRAIPGKARSAFPRQSAKRFCRELHKYKRLERFCASVES
ncbi:transcriptional regulator [Rhizobium sp. S9]|uniref:helix-turn-helix transcriptional regulator n=1 Tax=unclassified Rhizobium TaxID=2613769 RepID=UPI000A20FF5C|nr:MULTISPECIES: helix-turn-helix transcriptional regulator [unclassified Rhizobium]ARO25388.1 helix-turn-helix domain-containing protein [Rhizobium sp. TAL182]PDS95519.1 transcriptional regulator [Rhizobium sp. S9]